MATEISAEIICDSVSPAGHRLTTMQLVFPRFILPQITRHRVFSFSVESSRAVSTKELIRQVREDPVIPFVWGKNQPGMVADTELPTLDAEEAFADWLWAAEKAADSAEDLLNRSVHKQIVNRILEPFTWTHCVISGTEWENFYRQRIHPHAQPEIRVLAKRMRDAQNASVPRELKYGEWHMPYLQQVEYDIEGSEILHVSAARCAGASYGRLGKRRDVAQDLKVWAALRDGNPPHVGPMEHIAVAELDDDPYPTCALGNFEGWAQLRHLSEYWSNDDE